MIAQSYAMVTVEFDDVSADPQRRWLVPIGSDGLAFVIRDRGTIVGFSMRARTDLAAGEARLADVIDDDVREAAICARMRGRLAAAKPRPGRSMTVAICTKDRPHWVARLLASLVPLAGESVELLVVDNAPSDDATAEVVAEAGRVRYVREPLTGLDFARNRAVREAGGEVLAFLDDDVVVDPSWVQRMQRTWADNADAGAVTGLVMPMALDTPAQVLFERRGGFRRGFLPLRYGPTAFRDPLHPCGAGKFGAGANMSFDLALVRSLGGFDEALDTGRPLPGGGDLDMFYRVLRAGRPLVYEPGAAVFHDHRRDLPTLQRQYRSWGTGFGAFLVKSMQADPTMRPALRGVAAWWFGYQARRVVSRLAGHDPTPMAMIRSEIVGGIQGLCGEYNRSERRSARVRARLA